MGRVTLLLFLQHFLFFAAYTQAPKIITDYTITYTIEDVQKTNPENFTNASKKIFVKGKQARIDIKNATFSQSFILDYHTGNAVILKEMGDDKFLTTTTTEKWKTKNQRYENMQVSFINDTKTLLGFSCKKAIATLQDGTQLNIYYTPDIIPAAIENTCPFKDIPGFILQYECAENGSKKFLYTAIDLNLDPVPLAKFDIPSKGYRIL